MIPPAAAPLVHAFLSETPVPAGAEFLKHIEKAKITADGQTLSWSKQEDTYSVSLPKRLPKMIDGFCDLGVMKRGETSFRLLYTARVQFEPSLPIPSRRPATFCGRGSSKERGNRRSWW